MLLSIFKISGTRVDSNLVGLFKYPYTFSLVSTPSLPFFLTVLGGHIWSVEQNTIQLSVASPPSIALNLMTVLLVGPQHGIYRMVSVAELLNAKNVYMPLKIFCELKNIPSFA